MNSKEYLEASARTASSEWHDEIVTKQVLFNALTHAAAVGKKVDAIKKSLFYGAPLPEDIADNVPSSDSTRWDPNKVDHDVLHAAMGLFTEAVEMLECVTIGMFRELDEVNAIEECGDLEWYMAMMYRALKKTPEEAKAINIIKLKTRYPEKFDGEKANNRDLEKERQALEDHRGGE